MDLCGPIRIPSRGGKKYIFAIVDDYSRFTWTLFLRTKDEISPIFVAFVKQIQVKIGYNVVSNISDHGNEFDNAKFVEFCIENSINHNFSAPRTPQQNGVVERKNRTLEAMARTMLIDSCMPKIFWVEAVNMTCYLINKCMISSLLDKTPYELLNGRKPKMTCLRAFGCKYPGTPELLIFLLVDRAFVVETQGQRSEIHTSVDVNNDSNVEEPGFLSQIELKNIKEALEDTDWISAIQEELHQFERNKVLPGSLALRPNNDWNHVEQYDGGVKLLPWVASKANLKRDHDKSTEVHQGVLKRFDMENSKTIDTPIDTAIATRLDIDKPGSPVNETMYMSIIGSFLYLTASRPDIIFSVGMCARFQSSPRESHLKAAKRILGYLKGTQSMVIFYHDKQVTIDIAHI
ncbi:uncharacterized protein [Nicotiana tomentosiformis]|uniref:uncharacterized protein n=1 Tax=Nicotiana tomentosiformis TaxID=4098 RepID=UPI00388C8C7D